MRALVLDLDQGEAEAIALTLELGGTTVLIDESDGRAIARRLGLKPTGVLGVLLKAKEQGQIAAVKDEMLALQETAGFFIRADLFQKVIHLAEEDH